MLYLISLISSDLFSPVCLRHPWVGTSSTSQPVPVTAVVLSRRQCHPIIKSEDRDPISPTNLLTCSQLIDFANLLLKVAGTTVYQKWGRGYVPVWLK